MEMDRSAVEAGCCGGNVSIMHREGGMELGTRQAGKWAWGGECSCSVDKEAWVEYKKTSTPFSPRYNRTAPPQPFPPSLFPPSPFLLSPS